MPFTPFVLPITWILGLQRLVRVSVRLPAEQVGEGEGGSSELAVEPAAEVVEGDLGGEAGVEAAELVRPLALEAEGQQEPGIDGLDDLAEAGEPASERAVPVAPGGPVGGQITRAP